MLISKHICNTLASIDVQHRGCEDLMVLLKSCLWKLEVFLFVFVLFSNICDTRLLWELQFIMCNFTSLLFVSSEKDLILYLINFETQCRLCTILLYFHFSWKYPIYSIEWGVPFILFLKQNNNLLGLGSHYENHEHVFITFSVQCHFFIKMLFSLHYS